MLTDLCLTRGVKRLMPHPVYYDARSSECQTRYYTKSLNANLMELRGLSVSIAITVKTDLQESCEN